MIENQKYMDKDTAFQTLELINSWISNVDTKISFALAFIGVLAGVVFSKGLPYAYKSIGELKSISDISGCEILSAILVTALYLTSFICILRFLNGITAKVKNPNSNNCSMFFFGTISQKTVSEYTEQFLNANEDEVLRDITEQIHTNSKICNEKFRNYNKGIWCLIITTALWFICSIFQLL